MSPPKNKNRSSILKRRRSSIHDSPEATTTNTKQPRKILFSGKNTVKEFMPCDEKTTIWGQTYETSIARSESSDGSQTSKKLSLDFTSSTFQGTFHTTQAASIIYNADKENITIPPLRESTESVSTSSSTLSLDNLTVDFNNDEKKRVKKYGLDNLNITNMQLDGTISSPVVNPEKLILSPKKPTIFSNKSNIAVSIKENGLAKGYETSKSLGLQDISFHTELGEGRYLNTNRKTILEQQEMSLIYDSSSKTVMKSSLLKKQPLTTKEFKKPETPIKFIPKFLTEEANIDSPPIKRPNLQSQKHEVDELMEFMISDTPTKNLCHQMCSTKRASFTPLSSEQAPPKVIFSATKPAWKRKSTFDLDITEPSLNVNAKHSNLNESMQLESIKPIEEPEIDCQPVEDNIIIENHSPEAAQVSVKARKTLFEDDMSETLKVKSNGELAIQQETFFDLDIGETVAGTKSMTLMKLQDIPQQKIAKRETLYNEDLSFTCNFEHLASHKPSSTLINCTIMNETGVSEKTDELMTKASKLLRNPMMTTGSSSNIFSKTFQQVDELSFEETATPLHHQPASPQDCARRTVFEGNMSISIDHAETSQADLEESSESLNVPSVRGIEISKIKPSINKKSRFTVYEQSIEEESLREDKLKTLENKSRQTIYDEKIATETGTGTFGMTKAPEAKSRQTIYDEQMMIETEIIQSIKVPEVKAKQTLGQDQMIRQTIYDEKIATETGTGTFEITKAPEAKSRQTIYDEQMMIETEIIQSIKIPVVKAKQTLGQDQMTVEPVISKVPERKSRQTVYDERIELTEEITKAPAPAVRSRQTIYDEQMMTETEIVQSIKVPEVKAKQTLGQDQMTVEPMVEPVTTKVPERKSRQTVYDERIEVTEEITKAPAVRSRQTIYDEQLMSETGYFQSSPEHSGEIKPNNTRVTMFSGNVDETNMNIDEPSEIAPENSKFSCHVEDGASVSSYQEATQESINSYSPKETSLLRCANVSRNSHHLFSTTLPHMDDIKLSTVDKAVPFTITGDHFEIMIPEANMSINIEQAVSTSQKLREANETVNLPITDEINFSGEDQCTSKKSRFTVYEESMQEEPIHEEKLEMPGQSVRQSSNDCQIAVDKETSSDIPRKITRETVFESEMSYVETDITDHQRTFTGKQMSDSRRLMNITDAEISLIADESYPNENMSTTEQHLMQVSMGTSISSYQNALQEFVNITIMNSPLNMSLAAPQTPVVHKRAVRRVISPPINYCAKFDNLVENLKKKQVPQPRFEIDEFMERLNIKPRKVANLHMLDPEYWVKKGQENKTKIDRESAEAKAKKKALQAMQKPEIPSLDFLLSNKLESMLEESIRQAESRVPAIAMVFPEQQDFDFLLANKFETDEKLSKFWELDLIWAYRDLYKLTHINMEPYKINFKLQNPTGNINDSTFHVYFKEVMMYVNPNYRGRLSLRSKLLMNEFKHAINTDVFTSMCPSTAYLFDFLEKFHATVMKVSALIDNLFRIIRNHGAIFEHVDETLYIVKHHSNDDAIDVKIILSQFIDETTVSSIAVIGSTNFTYELSPRPTLASMKGLALIETVLFDTERFLKDHTLRSVTE